jgi:predicted RNA binding protein YcfA (HicA-like mRNA interferase family)
VEAIKSIKINTVPYHSGDILHPKVLKSILKDADLTIEDLKHFI